VSQLVARKTAWPFDKLHQAATSCDELGQAATNVIMERTRRAALLRVTTAAWAAAEVVCVVAVMVAGLVRGSTLC
jgi:hypothetical protein